MKLKRRRRIKRRLKVPKFFFFFFLSGGAHDSMWIDGSSELFTFPKLYSILIANIASLALPELIYE